MEGGEGYILLPMCIIKLFYDLCTAADAMPMSAMSSFVAATATPIIGQTRSSGDAKEAREVCVLWVGKRREDG